MDAGQPAVERGQRPDQPARSAVQLLTRTGDAGAGGDGHGGLQGWDRDRLTASTLLPPHREGYGLSAPATRDQGLNRARAPGAGRGCGPGAAV
ncbi:hypothetical protein GCM10009639_37640 [Kitasatospora putterlickiae]|uniref:Uncharacterized protein n=1 Tax=Kitasatospora putterlickiae TaxID=221725 RepID=A0ABN1Y5S7_9ACTN